MNPTSEQPAGQQESELWGDLSPDTQSSSSEILNPGALSLLIMLHRRFNARRLELLELRRFRQSQLDRGIRPDFLPETKEIRDGDWTVAPLPDQIADRRRRWPSARPTGAWPRCRPTCRTGASRLRAPSTGR